MEWIVLGSGTIIPNAERGSASHLLLSPQGAALFDTGSGTKDRLARAGVRFEAVTHLIYTHAHLDHWADLLSFLFYRAYTPESLRRPGQKIVGPKGFTTMAQETARSASPTLLEKNSDLVWEEIANGSVVDGGWFRARATKVVHGSQRALGYRIEGEQEGIGWSVAYSGDSGPCEGLFEIAKDVGVFVCECSLPIEDSVELHMTPEAVRELAERTRPGVLVLTHLYPQLFERGSVERAFKGYEGKLVVGADGLRIRLLAGESVQGGLSCQG